MADVARTNVRWGRGIAITLGVAMALSAMSGRVGSKSSAPAASRVYVVKPGDTVWRIALSVVGPGGDPRPVVDRLIALNHVRGGVIVPGERLSLP
jgi:LysM domain